MADRKCSPLAQDGAMYQGLDIAVTRVPLRSLMEDIWNIAFSTLECVTTVDCACWTLTAEVRSNIRHLPHIT